MLRQLKDWQDAGLLQPQSPTSQQPLGDTPTPSQSERPGPTELPSESGTRLPPSHLAPDGASAGYLSTRHSGARVAWRRSITMAVLGAVCWEIGLRLASTVESCRGQEYSTSDLPWTFHWLWELVALLPVVWLVRRWRVVGGAFVGFTLLLGFVANVFWFLVPFRPIPFTARFYGVNSRLSSEQHTEGREDRVVYDYPLHKGLLFSRDDPELQAYLGELKRDNENVGLQSFLFWQSGLAAGYDPGVLRQYPNELTVSARLRLFATVGPAVLLEALVRALFVEAPIFVVASVLWYLVRKTHLMWPPE